jgi:hypothetical protein
VTLSVILSEVKDLRGAIKNRYRLRLREAVRDLSTSFALLTSLRMTAGVLLLILMFAPPSFAQSSYGAGNGIANGMVSSGSGCTTSGTQILKGNGSGGCANASSGTDYVPPTSGTAIQKANGSGGLTGAVQNTDYFGGEITLCNGTNGTSGGTFTCYQTLAGHYKRTTCYLNAYYNTTGTAQTCSLTANGGSAFSSYGSFSGMGNVSPFAATLSGSPPNAITLPVNMQSPETGTLIVEGQ